MPDDTTLHTTSFGDHGSPVVFCHGLFGQGRNWTQIAKALPDHRVLLVDLPNHGRSAWTEDLDLIEDAHRLADVLGPEPVTLVGHSMGGKVAMLTALLHPERVSRLCVVDVSPVSYRHTSEFAAYIAAMQAIDLTLLERRDDADRQLREAVPNPTVRGFLLQNLRREDDGWRWQINLATLGEQLAEIGGWPEEGLAGVAPYDGPVLWIAGADSAYVLDEYAPAMESLFPRVRRVTIKNAGHWVHSEQPETFIAVLKRFLT
ncbi:alpha/beta fold hydrolase [Nocardioides houyundeii]|uniref:alpha/beta fold hydrolase n=1 Tax=Nocardioides houyundeii TaxID=2045452 RepID=UPI0018F007A7|nr:alpha/beta fold hydrolase [Nocardioides houyundeii]